MEGKEAAATISVTDVPLVEAGFGKSTIAFFFFFPILHFSYRTSSYYEEGGKLTEKPKLNAFWELEARLCVRGSLMPQ